MAWENKIKIGKLLSEFTSFKIGGPAEFFVEVENREDLKNAFLWARENKKKVFILGGGSNILAPSQGAAGLVVKIANRELEISGQEFSAAAGLPLSFLFSKVLAESLSGLEWAIGIPGTVGGAIRGNAGAFGRSFGDSVLEVEFYDIGQGRFLKIKKEDCGFGYRQSVFKLHPEWIIWEALLRYQRASAAEIKKLAEECINYRQSKQPKQPSAGSVFKNIDLKKLKEANLPLAVLAEEKGAVKNGLVAAGWIIDQLGLRERTIGGAKISPEHANFIVNTGKATSSDVAALISYIKQQARDKFKIQLEEEIEYFGF